MNLVCLFIISSLIITGSTIYLIERFKLRKFIFIVFFFFIAFILHAMLFYFMNIQTLGPVVMLFISATVFLVYLVFKFSQRFILENFFNESPTNLVLSLGFLLIFVNLVFSMLYWLMFIFAPAIFEIPLLESTDIYEVQGGFHQLQGATFHVFSEITQAQGKTYEVTLSPQHFYDFFYYAFAISYSLPTDDTLSNFQSYVSSNNYLRLVQIFHILTFKIFELVVIGLVIARLMDFFLTKKPITIKSIDAAKEIVVIQNNSKTSVNLEGYKLLSYRSERIFTFPEKTLGAGECTRVISGKTPVENDDLPWNKGNNWHNEYDLGILFDDLGNEISKKKTR